jgi:formylglycine-generating enzyme required for sulfatase activity
MLAPNTILQNRYRVIRQLGEGGMGTVYEAIDDRVSCVVAVKETLAPKDGEARRAFEREAALLANLRHASLPKVMDHFTEDDGQFLVMEFVPGYDLAELMEMRGNAFPLAQVMQWADDLLKVLEYLHGRTPPILHRDIKPSNLKLTRQGEIFLLDFGLAKGSAGQMPTLLTSRSVRGYTPVYASFEQVYGKGTDPRSDLYSLGATLYHLLTGVPPKDAPTRFDALEDEQPDPLTPIQGINPLVSPAVATVIHRAMAVSRKGRPANATAMRRALHEAVEETQRAEAERLDNLEQEQRRAEEVARLHAEAEAARRRAEESARRRAAEEEERRRQEEAESLRLQEEERRLREEEEEISKRNEEERRRREAEEEETQRRIEQTKDAQTKAANTVAAQTQRAKDMDAPLAASGVKTLEGKPDPLYKSADDVNPSQLGATPDEAATATGKNSERLWMIGGIALLVFIVIFAIVRTPQKGSASSESAKQQQVNNAQPTSVPPPSEMPSPPTTPPAGMAYVPGGEFMMGRDGDKTGYESPAHKVTVKPFFIDTYEVTNEDYAKFVKATNHVAPPGWTNGSYPAGAQRHPVTGVTWTDAVDYANWAGKRLPTEEEWEFAARGTDARRYPWGNTWNAGLANTQGASGDVVDVGSYQGQSPFGVFDMVGNAWEWTASNLTAYKKGQPLPDKPPGDLRVIRGGSYIEDKNEATTTYRRGYPVSGAGYDKTGFRCVKDVTDSSGQN